MQLRTHGQARCFPRPSVVLKKAESKPTICMGLSKKRPVNRWTLIWQGSTH